MKSKKYLQFQLEAQRDRADYFHAEKYLSDGYYAHFHRNAELYCVYEGAVTVTIGKNEYALRAGEGVFIDSLQVHSYLCATRRQRSALSCSARRSCSPSTRLIRTWRRPFF